MMNSTTNPGTCCHTWRSPKILLVLVAMVLLAGVLVIALLNDRLFSPNVWSASVVGQGKVSYTPDIASVTLGVQIDRVAAPDQALRQLNEKIGKIYQAIEAAGIPAEDIITQNYSLTPQYDNPGDVTKVAGYNANQQLLVKVKGIDADKEKVAKMVDAASKAGVNQILGIAFETSKLSDLKQQARLKAIADARGKSQEMGKALGIELGQITGWWENVISSPDVPNYNYGMGMGGGGGSVLPAGNVPEIVLELNISYEIED